MRISDCSSYVCSSVLQEFGHRECPGFALGDDLAPAEAFDLFGRIMFDPGELGFADLAAFARVAVEPEPEDQEEGAESACVDEGFAPVEARSEEHTSELQSLMRTSYAVFCLNKNTMTKMLNI